MLMLFSYSLLWMWNESPHILVLICVRWVAPVHLSRPVLENIMDFPDVLDKLIRSWLIEPIYDLYSYPRRSAARHCEIRPPVCENLLSSDFTSGR